MKNIKIYGLVDPQTKEVRYIGKTIQTLNRRLYKHIYDSKYLIESKTHKNNWIRKLTSLGLKPEIILLEENINSDWSKIEIDYIKKYKELGCNLTNSTEGGEGQHGRLMSDETKAKISIANKGKVRDIETRKRISNARTGIVLSEETKNKISESKKGCTHTLESNLKRSEKMKGDKNHFYGKKHSKDVLSKISSVNKGNSNRSKKVKQIDIVTGEVIKIWDSSRLAANELGINYKGISKVCNGNKKTYKGYKWEN